MSRMRNSKCEIRNEAAARPCPRLRRVHAFPIPHSPFRIAPRPRGAFTLFEVLIALGVFAISVTGLAIALDSAVMGAFEARQSALGRMALESRLSSAMSDPPLNGKRVIEARDNNGVRVEETMEVFEAKTTNGTPVSGLWKLKIAADWGRGNKSKETAEILFYKP